MADDIKIKLGLDAAALFAGLQKAFSELSKLSGIDLNIGTDQVVSDLNKLQSEAKQSEQALDKMADTNLKEVASDADKLAKAVDGVGDAAKGTGGILDGLKGGLNDAFSGGLIGSFIGGGIAGGVQAGIGAIVSGFGAVIEKGNALIAAQGDLQAQTGATGAEFEALKKEAEDAFLGGVGESVAEATKVISNAKTVLKDALPVDQIGEFTAKAQALGNLYDKDVNEVIAKSTPFIKQFGLDGDQAFNLIALAAKEGKTSQDDVLDTLAEYSQLLQEAGFSAEEFTGALVVAGQEGLFNTDKIADSIKEAQIRLKAGDTAKAFTDIKNQLPAALGDTLGNLQQLASSGQITIREFLQKSGESIKTAFDSGQISEAMASQLQVAVAGTPAEDIGVEAYNKIFAAPIPTDEITKKATEAGKAASGAVGQYTSFEAVSKKLTLEFEKASAGIMRSLEPAFAFIFQLLDQAQKIFTEVFSDISVNANTLGQGMQLLGQMIQQYAIAYLEILINWWRTLYDIAVYALEEITGAFQPLIDAFGGAQGQADFLTEAAKVLFDILKTVAKFIIDVVAFNINILATAFGGVVIAIRQVIEFFTNLDAVGAGLAASMGSIATTIKQVFDAIINLNWGAIPNLISSAFGNANKAYQDAYEATKRQKDAQQQLKQEIINTKVEQEKAAQSAQKQANEVAQKPVSTAAKVAGAKAGAQAESFAKLDELKKFYETEAKEIDSANKRKIDAARVAGEDIKELQAKLDDEAAKKLRAFLNERLAGVKDNTELLNKEQINTVLKPANPKQMLDIETFYVNEFDKLGKKLAVEPKVKLPDFKEELKGFETAVKDIEKNVDALIPKTLATSQEALDANTSQITKYLDFIKSQNAEIETLKTEALLAGNIEAAESFDAQINRNVLSINTLTSRLATYQTDSKKAIDKAAEESTLTFQLTTALQTNILDAFNTERINKEREANEALRAEKLGALDQEEKDLTTSLAKREVSFEEYAAKMADIDAARQQAMEDTEVTFMERLKEVQDKTVASLLRSQSSAITGFVTDQFKDAEGNVTEKGKIIGESMTALTEKFASLAESGKATLGDFGNAAAAVAFDAVSKMIPSFVAGILGSSITALGPIAGPIAAGLLTASLQLLIGQAKAALGFKDGVIDLAGPGTETSDSIPAWLSKGESVITAASTKANKEELAWMNANPGMSIRDYFTSHAPQVRYSVGEDGGLIREVQKLREETRGLGRQINRNTHVSISGELKADNNSIKAVIESERRRNARRG